MMVGCFLIVIVNNSKWLVITVGSLLIVFNSIVIEFNNLLKVYIASDGWLLWCFINNHSETIIIIKLVDNDGWFFIIVIDNHYCGHGG